MSKIPTITSSVGKIEKRIPTITINTQKLSSSSNLKEKAQRCYMDFSTEDQDFFTRRDSKGNVLEVIRTIFPR